MGAHLDKDGVELRALVVVRQDGLGQLGVGAHLPAVHLQQSATRGLTYNVQLSIGVLCPLSSEKLIVPCL